MEIVFIPYYKENPYQKLLADSISRLNKNVKIHFHTEFSFSVLGLVRKYWKVDILHLHWPSPFLLATNVIKTIIKSVSFLCELLILKLFGIKIVWTVHNIVNHEEKFSSIELFFNKIIARLSSKIIVHSPSVKVEVMQAYRLTKNSLIEIIPHGNFINFYENVLSKREVRQQLHLNEDEIIFLYIGLIRPYKGILELIATFKRLNAQRTKLLICGRPINIEIRNEILKECGRDKNIKTFLKFIPDNEIQIYMNAADIIILPFTNILTSSTIILAMSFGKPIIAPLLGCIQDVLDEKGSFLYEPSEDGLFKAMIQALNTDIKKMGEHNLKLVQQWTWNEVADKTYRVYQEAMLHK
jgi:glycosyltransferase involved in cell wall biosynthesis